MAGLIPILAEVRSTFGLPVPGKPYGPTAIQESAAQAMNEFLAQQAMHREPVTPTVV